MSSAPLIVFMDLSKTNTGIAFGRAGETPKSISIKCSGIDDRDALKRIGKWLIDFTKMEEIDWLFVEASIHPGAFLGEWDEQRQKVRATSNPQTTVILAKIVGVVEFIAGMKAIKYRTAHVQSVRKTFLGHGRPNDPKKRVKVMCHELGWKPANEDEADALAGWHYATVQVAPRLYQPITPLMMQRVASVSDQAAAARAAGLKG